MDYEKLKEVIAKQIKENGQREITGPVLQAVLMAMVDSLGEVYPHTYTDEEKAQARANIDALSNHNGEITKEKLSLEVQAILNDVANKQNISDATLATIAKTIVGAINEVYKGGLEDASIATSKIKDGAVTDAKIANGAVTTPKIANDAVTTEKVNDGAITEPKLDTDLVNIITSAVQPAGLASAIATALASYVAKADIVDTTGSATDKVMSQHGVTEAIDVVTNKVTELDEYVNTLNLLNVTEETAFSVTDENGNAALIVDNEGNLDASGLGNNLKNVVKDLNGFTNTQEDVLAITDNNGNVVAKVDNQGHFDVSGIGENLTSIIKSFSKGESVGLASMLNLRSLSAAYRKSMSEREPSLSTHDVTVIPLKKSGKQRLLLCLHRRENNGFMAENSAWLPNANKDFSDVRITANGKPLKYMPIFTGNIDILLDKRLGSNVNDSTIGWYNGVGYMVYQSKICSCTDNFNTKTPLPVFSDLTPVRLIRILDNGTMFVVSNYKVYRSAYPYSDKEMVYDGSEYSESFPNKELISQFKGALYMGHYQEKPRRIKIDKSIDDGLTWTEIYKTEGEDSYQHIHSMYVDSVNGVLYVGCDDGDARHGGGGIMFTTDGETWNDYRKDNPDIPHATDYGVILVNGDEKYVGGETSISGGFTLQKTIDGLTFEPVLATGKACYWITKKGELLISALLSSGFSRDSQIMISIDNGKTWETAFTTAFMPESKGASDGFRKYCIIDNAIITQFQQGQDIFAARILVGEENYYSQVIVDVPDGVNEIVVEDGYCYPNLLMVRNEYDKNAYVTINGKENIKAVSINGDITSYPLSGNQELIQDSIGSVMNTLFTGKYSFEIGEGIVINSLTLPNSFHVGFKLKLIKPFSPNTITIIADSTNKITLFNGKLIRINNVNKGYHRVDVRDSWLTFDINFNNGEVETFVNGKKLSDDSIDPTYNQEDITFNGVCTICKCTSDIYHMADFEITDVLTEEEIKNKNYAYLTDNIF